MEVAPSKRVTFDESANVYYTIPTANRKRERRCCYRSVIYDGTTVVLVNGEYAYSRPNQVVVMKAGRRHVYVSPVVTQSIVASEHEDEVTDV